jgi:hypothetical protein
MSNIRELIAPIFAYYTIISKERKGYPKRNQEK